jgi:hypothetical protein
VTDHREAHRRLPPFPRIGGPSLPEWLIRRPPLPDDPLWLRLMHYPLSILAGGVAGLLGGVILAVIWLLRLVVVVPVLLLRGTPVEWTPLDTAELMLVWKAMFGACIAAGLAAGALSPLARRLPGVLCVGGVAGIVLVAGVVSAMEGWPGIAVLTRIYVWLPGAALGAIGGLWYWRQGLHEV